MCLGHRSIVLREDETCGKFVEAEFVKPPKIEEISLAEIPDAHRKVWVITFE